MSARPTIEVRSLVVRYGSNMIAVAGADLELSAGVATGLVGESGSGKTTVARAITGLTPLAAGTITIAGRDVRAMSGSERRRWLPIQIQMIFQDPGASLSPRLRVRQLLSEPLRIHRLKSEAWRIGDLLNSLGLSEAVLEKYPHQLSGGQARRVAIARALVLHPKILIADEPTAGLDVSVQGDFLNLMSSLQARLGIGTLFISHNLNVVARTTKQLLVMYLGKVVERGPTRQIFAKPTHPYTAALLSATAEIDPARRKRRIVLKGDMPSPLRPPSGCRFHTRCWQAQPRCAIEEPALAVYAPEQFAACHYPLL